jgi:hypothetical protein
MRNAASYEYDGNLRTHLKNSSKRCLDQGQIDKLKKKLKLSSSDVFDIIHSAAI